MIHMIMTEKRYGELIARLVEMQKTHDELRKIAVETEDYDLTNAANAARDRYNAEVDKIADVLGVFSGLINDDVMKAMA